MTKRTSDKSSLIKVNTATVIAVLALHIGIAAALTHMQMPEQIVEKPEEIKPVEIQLLSLEETPEPIPKAELPKEVEQPTPVPQPVLASEQPTNSETKPQTKPQNEPKPEPPPKPKSEDPKPQTKSESHAEPEPLDKPQPPNKPDPEPQLIKDIESQTKPVPESKVEPVVEPETLTTKDLTPIIDSNEHQRLIEQMVREKAAQEKAAQEKAAQEKAAQERAAQEKAAQEKAAQEKVAQEKVAQEKAAANNTPKSFSESQARWKRKPKLILPQQVDRRARLGEIFSLTLEVIVDKQGNVTKVTVTKSSGNKIVDNVTVTEVKRSKLHPFTEDNLPVVGKIILPVEYVKK
ncbi:energy transducer TonB [Psychrobacter sanguinis]|uniref:energy transducer TonB n=1 Tax=Psychrobacter sanguinis TaxID=861445 RepID=UPI002A754226|nr:energy transducer TonB [Psychrobacter sanguinis]MDY3306974.1 energy transducer TonB [Psychrobacter sanguinis]